MRNDGLSVAGMRIDFYELILPRERVSVFGLLVILDQRAAQLGFFDLGWNEIVEVLLLLRIVEVIDDGMGAVIKEIVGVLA